MDVSALLPGVATVLLAVFGGAGSSLLLELWWNPRRARRRVAALLAEEVNLNAQILKLHVHVRRTDPGNIAADFQLMRLAFDAVAQEVGVLPAKVAGQVILTYHYFDRLNRLREMFGERLGRWREAQRTKRDDVKELERNAIGAVDAFNVLIDVTYKAAGELLPVLLRYAPKRERRAVSDEEYAERVRTAEAERVARMSRVKGV
jgi:hypothetical protein